MGETTMSPGQESTDLITPPAGVPEARSDDWLPLPVADPVTEYIAVHHWDQPTAPNSWEVARLSRAAYVYRETTTRSAVLAKFYAEKTGENAKRYARSEFEHTQRARTAGLAAGNARAVRPTATRQPPISSFPGTALLWPWTGNGYTWPIQPLIWGD
jgi:hypothetical protein